MYPTSLGRLCSARHWYSRKPYLHFDVPLGRELAERLVKDPSKVASHAFYPLLTYNLVTPSIRRASSGAERPFVRENKTRPISYPAHKDGYIFAYYKACLEKNYESWVDHHGMGKSITAFRSIGEDNISLAQQAFDFVATNPDHSIVVSDVESFFPNISHSLLKNVWACFLEVDRLPDDHFAVYKATTCFSEVERHKAFNAFRIPLNTQFAHDQRRICTTRQFRTKIAGKLTRRNPGLADRIGIPQGSPLSPLLSNMYMANFDLSMYGWVKSIGGSYCDDILVVAPRPSVEIIKRMDKELSSARLQRSEKKTHCYSPRAISSNRPLQYLGFMFDGHNTTVRPSSVHRFHRKLKAAIGAAQHRQHRESGASSMPAPLRKRALYNMYSDSPRRGTKIVAAMKNRRYKGNFTHYLLRAAQRMKSGRIAKQRKRVLKRFRDRIRGVK